MQINTLENLFTNASSLTQPKPGDAVDVHKSSPDEEAPPAPESSSGAFRQAPPAAAGPASADRPGRRRGRIPNDLKPPRFGNRLKVMNNDKDTADPRPNCGNCVQSVDTGDPETVVCVAYLDYRDPKTGGDCPYYARKARRPEPEAENTAS